MGTYILGVITITICYANMVVIRKQIFNRKMVRDVVPVGLHLALLLNLKMLPV
jgi:hypothetical protein